MEFFAKLNIFFHKTHIRFLRFVLFLVLILLVFNQVLNEQPARLELFLLNLLIIVEIFFRYKIGRITPSISVVKNDGHDVYSSFTLEALILFLSARDAGDILRALLGKASVRCFMQKANIREKEVGIVQMKLSTLAESALDVAKTFNGKFVTTLDIFIAYLMIIESDSKVFFAKQLKTADLNNLLLWVRREYVEREENPPKRRWHFIGGGLGESLVGGWTPESKKYVVNFTYEAIKTNASIVGREREFRTMLEGLIRAEANNVLLVGDPGSGRENLVRAFANNSFTGNIGSNLNYRKVMELMLGSFTAGASNRSDLETRLQTLISEVSHALDVIIYIPEIQNIMGASAYNLDISGALMPYLRSGNMPIIATVSKGNYKAYIERNPIKEVFTVVELADLDKNTAIQMVLNKVEEVEGKNKVIVSYRAICSAVELADRFFQDQALPGNAISLLQDVANKVALSDQSYFEHTRRRMVLEENVVKHVEDKTHVAISMPGKKEIDVLLHLEDKLHERVINQNDAINAIAEAMRRVRSGMSMAEKPVSFLFLGPTGVGKTETTKALSDLYFGGERKMIRLDMSEYTDEIGIRRLLGAPPGEGNERGELTDKIHEEPASLVLLDEFEKAHPKILDLFLQVLDDGRLTDNKGVTVSFRNALIVATSNAGSEFIREEVGKGVVVDKKFQTRLMDNLQRDKIFKPELLNRFDGVIIFKPLGPNEIKQVTNLLLKKIAGDLENQDVKIVFDDAVVEKICEEGFDKDFGARPLRRYIQDNIEDLIAKAKLTGEIARGKSIAVGIDGANNIKLTVS